MSKKKQVLEILKRDCVNGNSIMFIEDYIENISRLKTELEEKYKEIKNSPPNNNDVVLKLQQQLEAKENENRRLNLDAQKWFDIAMDLLHGKTKPEDYK